MLVVGVWLGILLVVNAASGLITDLKCEPIQIDICGRLGYKQTGLPNLMGHQLQSDAKASLETFYILIEYNCAPDLLFFLCSVHVPMCVSLPPTPQSKLPQHQLIGPCRPMCERVKSSCYPILQQVSLPWPESLECSRFPPENSLDQMCMEGGDGQEPNPTLQPGKALNTLHNYPSVLERLKDFNAGKPELTNFDPYLKMLLETSMHNIKPAKGFSESCSELAAPVNYHYLNRSAQCIPKCGTDVLFDKEDKHFAEIWLAVWSVLCFLTSLFTLLTYLLDTSRFKYPEKCIIFLNLSYNILSVGYLLRLLLGAEGVACSATPGEPSLLVRDGLTPTTACTVVFIILYFSSLAAAVWWTITTTTWAVLVFCSLDVTSLETRSPLFHMVGWTLPAAQTISALIYHQIEGDELTGICLPGQQTEDTLLNQLVIPHAAFLGSASLFFLAGVVGSLVNPGDRNRKLLARIGIFSIFYTLPQICVLGSLVYEWIERPLWRTDPVNKPIIEVFMMRIAMWLVVGIISGSWVWSHRTVLLWKSWFGRCAGYWRRDKKPPTPVFPKVAYRAAPTKPKENVMTLDNLATLRRSQKSTQSTAGGLPYTVENNRIIL